MKFFTLEGQFLAIAIKMWHFCNQDIRNHLTLKKVPETHNYVQYMLQSDVTFWATKQLQAPRP